VTGRERGRADAFEQAIRRAGLPCAAWRLAAEPTVDDAVAAIEAARSAGADVVVGIGGGSALDLGKAVAALLANPGHPLDYLEVVGRGHALAAPSVPYVAVPTTAGTGAEVTRNAVLADRRSGVKVSLRSPFMLPRLAIVDPGLTLGLPSALTASTGMDALTQVVEPYLSVRANPLTDGFCLDGMARVARSLRRAVTHGDDLDARTDVALASLLGGLALANAGLGAVHGVAAPIGGRFAAPHGAVCAAVLPAAMRVNLDAVRQRATTQATLARFTTVARVLTGEESARADDGIAWLERLRDDLGIPPLSHYGVTAADLDPLAADAARASSMKGNCIVLEPGELRRVLDLSL
jgi:alcohol dehydrogenase class IV